jgi:hypothetical protein
MRTYVRRAENRTPQPNGPNQIGRSITVPVPHWVDPYWWIQGSEPEKMVMAELVRRGIYFEHTPQKNPLHWGAAKALALSDPTDWEPDFLFPQYRIWLEVNGTYFHTLPGAIFHDAFRATLIEGAGWKPVIWMDYEISANLIGLFDSVPEFNDVKRADQRGMRTNVEGRFWEGLLGKKAIDHSAGIRTQNRMRTKPPEFVNRWRYSYTRSPK